MDLTDEYWSTVRHTTPVTGFVGHSHQPVPLSMTAVENMLAPAVVAAASAEAQAAASDSGAPAAAAGQSYRKPVRDDVSAVPDSAIVGDCPLPAHHATTTKTTR